MRGASNQSTSEYFTGSPSLKMGVQSPAVNLSTWQGSSPFRVFEGRSPKRPLGLHIAAARQGFNAAIHCRSRVRPSVPFHDRRSRLRAH
jgi:hypothetical protein